MKRLLVLVLLLTAFSITAQNGPRHQRGQHDKGHMEMLKDLSPEEAATLKTKKMVLDLNLSEAQQNEIYALNLKNARERQAKRAEMQKKRDGNEGVKPSKEEKLKSLNSRLDNQIAHKKNMQKVLNKEQFEKWERHAKQGQNKRKMKKHRSKRSR